MWATMRWSGRTARPSTCHVRWRISTVSAEKKPAWSRSWRSWLTWMIDGRVGHEDPAGHEGLGGMGHDLPRLGQVEHDAVQVGLVDALVAVPDLDPVAAERLVAEEVRHVGLGPGREVLADLVADDSAPARSRVIDSAPEPDARLEHPGAGEDVGQQQQGSEVLGVDDLRPPLHLQDEVGQGRSDDPVRARRSWPAGAGPRTADDVVVGHDPGVGVELPALVQAHEVAPVLAVDEHHLLARRQRSAVGQEATLRTGAATGWVWEARSARRQNAHTSPGVGAPQRAQADRATPSPCSSSAVKRSAARSR